jgi:glycosyltransferase involved in cell wall biosynthesis
MTRPTICCIVPVYNCERYLAQALDSVLAQTYWPLRIVVVDDGSTDGTASVAATYKDRIAYLFQENAGPAAARNAGLGQARERFVAFLDADDVWHPDKLAKQMACFEADPDLDLCLTQVANFWSPELEVEPELRGDERMTAPWPGYTCSSLLARRSAFDRAGLFDPALIVGEDGEWFRRVSRLGLRHHMLPEILTRRRLHEHNLTRRRREESREALLRRVKASIDARRSG